jgi:glycosyltransferase involved in cell wall biosynthesis
MIVHDYLPEEARVMAEARAAVVAGFAVDVLALRGEDEAPSATIDGINVIRLPVVHKHGGGKGALISEFVNFTLRSALKAASLTRKHVYDVVEVHNPPDFLVVSALIPMLRGAKSILDVHDLTPDMYMMRFENRPGGLLDRALRMVELAAARASDAVLTVHEPYRQELAAHGVPLDKISVVMNSLDEGLLPESLDPPPESDVFRIVYHGTVTPHYGVDLLVEAVALARADIPNLRLEIYGAGDAHADVQARVKRHGLDDVVRIVPRFIPQEEVLRHVIGASVGVVPNRPTRLNRFALSTKLLEYAALGIPIVSADLPTIREHFSAEEVWFFEPGSAEAAAKALVAVAADPAAAHERAEAARRRYEAYRWERSARVFTELLWQLAGRPRRGTIALRPPEPATP